MPDDRPFEEARSLLLSGRTEEALGALAEMLAADPDHLGALQLKAANPDAVLAQYASLVEEELAEAQKEEC